MDLLEQTELSRDERLGLLEGTHEHVREIGKSLLDHDLKVEDGDIREAVEQIRIWVEEVTRIQNRRFALK